MLCLFSVSLCCFSAGCSRGFWRKQADKDSYQAIQQAETDGRWMLPRINVKPDSRSRFYDPHSADCTPLPPDDPAAAKYMKCSDGIPGYKSWHKFGKVMSVENPQWMYQFEVHEDMVDPDTGEKTGPIPAIKNMTLSQAIELSYIHSRDYQTELENLFLAALDLTFQRFRFQVRYFGAGGGEPSATVTGTSVPSGQNTLGANSRFGISQLLPTGGQWAVELANNTLWFFSGQNQTSSASVLSYSLVQPLLAGAGRMVALESLTQTERDLLYATRDLARFRKELFVDTVGDGGGFLSLLQQIQSIRNQRGNIKRLARQVDILREQASQPPGQLSEVLRVKPADLVIPKQLELKLRYTPGKIIWYGSMTREQADLASKASQDPNYQRAIRELIQLFGAGGDRQTVTLDVAQLETSLLNSQNQLRSQEVAFQNALDRYKINLGLPPELLMTIDDSLLEQFQLIDQVLTDLETEVTDYVAQKAKMSERGASLETIKKVLAGLLRLHQKVKTEGLVLVEKDADQVREKLTASGADQSAFYRDRELLTEVQNRMEAIESDIRAIAVDIGAQEVQPEFLTQIKTEITIIYERLLKQTQSLQVIQADLRVELITTNEFTVPLEQAIGIAMENRLDLMNQRGVVMDARRNQEIAARDLQAVLNVVVEGDIRTDPNGNNPLDFRGSSSSFRAGLAITAPIDQIAERNAYRASQIAYQRTKRNYSLFEDNVKFQVRSSWRSLDVLKRNLETARLTLRSAALQYDNAVEEASRPAKSGQSNQGGVQGRNLINALESVLRAQDALIRIWVDYESSRLNIYRDMGIMEIDQNGLWMDSFYQKSSATPESQDTIIEAFEVPEVSNSTSSVLIPIHHKESTTTYPRNLSVSKTSVSVRDRDEQNLPKQRNQKSKAQREYDGESTFISPTPRGNQPRPSVRRTSYSIGHRLLDGDASVR